MVRQIRVTDLAEMIKQGEPVWLLDVRREWEHATASLPESVLIPLDELPLRLDEVQPPTGATVVVYCHHGVRSISGAAILQSAGIESVVSLAGGIDAWSERVDPSVPRY